jgi:hypothetical protein
VGQHFWTGQLRCQPSPGGVPSQHAAQQLGGERQPVQPVAPGGPAVPSGGDEQRHPGRGSPSSVSGVKSVRVVVGQPGRHGRRRWPREGHSPAAAAAGSQPAGGPAGLLRYQVTDAQAAHLIRAEAGLGEQPNDGEVAGADPAASVGGAQQLLVLGW